MRAHDVQEQEHPVRLRHPPGVPRAGLHPGRPLQPRHRPEQGRPVPRHALPPRPRRGAALRASSVVASTTTCCFCFAVGLGTRVVRTSLLLKCRARWRSLGWTDVPFRLTVCVQCVCAGCVVVIVVARAPSLSGAALLQLTEKTNFKGAVYMTCVRQRCGF